MEDESHNSGLQHQKRTKLDNNPWQNQGYKYNLRMRKCAPLKYNETNENETQLKTKAHGINTRETKSYLFYLFQFSLFCFYNLLITIFVGQNNGVYEC